MNGTPLTLFPRVADRRDCLRGPLLDFEQLSECIRRNRAALWEPPEGGRKLLKLGLH